MTTNDDRRAAELRAQGKSWSEIATALEGPGHLNPDGSDPAVVAQLSELQGHRERLGTGGTPAGKEPAANPLDVALHAGTDARFAGGGHAGQAAAYLDELFQQAAGGDPRVVADRATSPVVQGWREQSRERLIDRARQAHERTAGGAR